MKIILDLDTKEIYTEVKVRCLLLQEECGDILNNQIDYVREEMNIDAQLNCLRFAIKEQNIEKIVKALNENWNYNIKIFEEVKEN